MFLDVKLEYFIKPEQDRHQFAPRILNRIKNDGLLPLHLDDGLLQHVHLQMLRLLQALVVREGEVHVKQGVFVQVQGEHTHVGPLVSFCHHRLLPQLGQHQRHLSLRCIVHEHIDCLGSRVRSQLGVEIWAPGQNSKSIRARGGQQNQGQEGADHHRHHALAAAHGSDDVAREEDR